MTCSEPKLRMAFWGYMLAYVGSILGMAASKDSLEGSILLWIACIIPAFFCLMGMREIFKGVMAMDEMLRRIHTEAFMIGAGITAMITFTWGLLENAGLPVFQAIYVFPMMMVLYGLAVQLRARSYD